ncbi:MAG: DUF4838 domain-containing protein, partial [Kiritimatiellae bacterium]|nr:DUF4838 domain-containing protein [Kiritimatiellia bacterium]
MNVRHTAGWLAITALVAGFCAPAMAFGSRTFTLTREGQPAAAIVLAEKPSKAAQFAAFELQWHVKAISGATLPIVRDTAAVPAGHVKLHVGDSPRVRKLGLSQESFKLQEYAIRARRGELALVGKDAPDFAAVAYDLTALNDLTKNANWPGFWEERGTLHAVHDLLRDGCGVRWLQPTDTGTLLPSKATLTVKVRNTRRAPTFRYREAISGNVEVYDRSVSLWGPKKEVGFRAWESLAYAESHGRMGNSGWPVKRFQSSLFLLRMRNGGELCRANHSMYHYYELYWKPSRNQEAAKYFAGRRPELFAQGYKEDPPPQMCYASTALVELVSQEATDYFKRGGYPYPTALSTAPSGPKWGENYFCVEPMDNASFCKCTTCQALLVQGTNYGAGAFFSQGIHSDYMFDFVNRVARKAKPARPEQHIVTLAYGTHAWVPQHVKLDPTVAVQFCFSTDSWPWHPEYEHEWRLTQAWADEAKVSGRPMYAWCYLGHLAKAFSFFGNYNGFPGCFAHAIGKEFKYYQRLGYRGMFHCGIPMEVDSYVMFRLMDNADLDVDVLLDEYFKGLYGDAGEPLKKFYLGLEAVFCDPNVRQGQIPNGGTAQEIDWTYLGTEARMAEYAQYVAQARQLAGTDREKRNVALFEKAIWNYMVEGRAAFLSKQWWRKPDRPAYLTVPACAPIADGDPLKADFTAAGIITNWLAESGGATTQQLSARFVTDGRQLYAELQDGTSGGRAGDAWEIVVALRRRLPLYRLRVTDDGVCRSSLQGAPGAWDSGAVARVMPSSSGAATVRVAIPLSGLAGGIEAGWSIFGNVTRIPEGGSPAVWLPTVVGAEPVEWLGQIALAPARGAISLAANALPAPGLVETSRTVSAGVTLRTVAPYRLEMAVDDLLQSKTMKVETPGAHLHSFGRSYADSLGVLTDAVTPRTATDNVFIEGVPEIVLT